ncbi:transferase [Mycolicibacterium conceptionense]|uniref:Transferase n=1 Tax=Mycolicibacterium conceptionense TaxID=451644 RepID=A0A0U1CZS2_9MYCO|nr:transferase [Mycolicibacterium conceptionense]
MSFAIVVPTIGRDSLQRLLAGLERSDGPAPEAVIVVDDRADPEPPLRVVTGPPRDRVAQRRPRTGRGAQPRLAAYDGALGSVFSTTMCSRSQIG